MTDYNNWLETNGKKLKLVYSYAVIHKIDINSNDEIAKILEKIDPENANIEQAKIYSKMLQLFKNRFRSIIKEREKVDPIAS